VNIILDLFSKEKRAKKDFLRKYASLKNLRVELEKYIIIETFRQLTDVYGELDICFPTKYYDFVAISQKSKALIEGDFAFIREMPDFDHFIYDDKQPDKYDISDVDDCIYYYREQLVKAVNLIIRPSYHGNSNYKISSNCYGYDLEEFWRISVIRNKRKILTVDVKNKITPSQALSLLHEQIVNTNINDQDVNGLSVIRIIIDIDYAYSENHSFEYNFVYDDRPTINESSFHNRTHVFKQIAPIVRGAATYLSTAPYNEYLDQRWQYEEEHTTKYGDRHFY